MTTHISITPSWTKVAETVQNNLLVTWDVPVAVEFATTLNDVTPDVTGHVLTREKVINRALLGAGYVWARTVPGSTPQSIELVVSAIEAASGGGGGGASGSVTLPGVNGTTAQGVQGITNGLPLNVNQAAITFVNSTANNSTAQLAAGVSFVGAWENAYSQPAVQVLGESDQATRYTIEQAIDSGGLDVVSSVSFTRGKGEDLCENVQINGNFLRVTAKNIGSTTATEFVLACTYGPLPPMAQALSNYGNQRTSARETQNFNRKLRDAMEVYPNPNWPTSSKASGDLIRLDGNAVGASYLVMSLNPLVAGTETYIDSDAVFKMPLDIGVGLHTSQRTYGQELSVAVISGDDGSPVAEPAELTISSIQQAASVLTVTTSAVHNLKVGMRFGVYGVTQDSRLNYAALVVASTPSTTQFTATAGPQGTISALTVGPFASGFVYQRDAMSRAVNGTSMVFENATVTNASFYAKSEGGDSTPFGGPTLNANHSTGISMTASVQAVAAALNYTFRPTTQFLLSQQADRVTWNDAAIDTAGQRTLRANMDQVVPNPDVLYKLRFKVANRKGLTVPTAKITSASKAGTATATVTCPSHGLTTGDYVAIYGNRDQTNFTNLSTTIVASVVDANTFTLVWGAAVTATGYGGFVSRVQGQQVQQGAITQAASSYSITTSILTLIGNAAWAGLLIGDYVNLHGCRVDLTGVDAGIDGVYRVRDLATTNLVLEPIGGTTIPATQTTVNIGGGVIKRTDLRISFVRVFDYERLRVEALPRAFNDAASAAPMVIQGGVTVSGTTTATQGTGAAIGTEGVGAWGVRYIPSRTVDIASAAITSTQTSSAISLLNNTGSFQVNFDVSAVTGTLPRMLGRVQGSFDNGVSFVNIYDVGVATTSTAKNFDTPTMPGEFTHIRYVRSVTGTAPSFTNSVNRVLRPGEDVKRNRRMVDLVMALTATTPSTELLYVTGCVKGQIVCTALTGATTVPQLKLQAVSGDPAIAGNWYDVAGATLTTSAAGAVASAIFDLPHARFVRLVPTVAGVATPASTAYELSVLAWE